jgi:signal transduction histidine kinase
VNFAAYIPLAGCIFNVLFSLFLFSRSPRARVAQIFLLLGLSIAVWNLGSYFLFVVQDRERALFWARFLQFGVMFGMGAFVHLSILLGDIKVGRWIFAFYVLLGLLALLILTPYYVADVRLLGRSGWYAVAGPAFHVINIPYAISLISVAILITRRRKMRRAQQRQVTPLIYGQSMLALLGMNDLMPIIGIDHYPFFPTVTVYPYGSLAAVFYCIIVSYAVLQHQLLDFRVALSGALAYFVRFTFLFAITGGLLVAMAAFSNAFNAISFTLSLAVFMIAAVSASLLFPRLFGGKGMETWERRIVGDRFEYQDQLRSFVANMSWYSEMNTLLNDLHDLFVSTLRLSRYHMIMSEEASGIFSLLRAHPEEPQRQIPELRLESPIFQYFGWRKAEYLALNAEFVRLSETVLERQAREQIAPFRAELCLPLATENEAFGLLIVGSKISGEPFTATDINLLVALTKNLSLVMNQIRLKTQVLHAQELELLGRMSRGMAHDLNNLLTPVWTLFQLANEAGSEGLDPELLPVALRNVKTMRAYIKEALFFSEHMRPDLQLGRLDLVVQQAIEVARTSRNKEIEIVPHIAGMVYAEVDEVLIQRLVANLIANAIDASPAGELVEVHLSRLPAGDAAREWLRVRVTDHGEGIPKENLSRILTPYFTTKDRGDENRGFGLGLAICRKIVNLHGGNLAISSQIRKGTTVNVDLPSRQAKPASVQIVAAAS